MDKIYCTTLKYCDECQHYIDGNKRERGEEMADSLNSPRQNVPSGKKIELGEKQMSDGVGIGRGLGKT